MKEKIASLLKPQTNLTEKEILNLIEIPKDSNLGDYAFPCFTLAKTFKKNPIEIAKEISEKLKKENQKTKQFEKIEQAGAYINFFINRNFLVEETLKKIQKEKDKFGYQNIGKNKTIVIDLSAPNIAKPFGIGHLRSTIIGSSISNISNALGFKTIKINYLGDWGTQFGKLITAYKKWGSQSKLKNNPIKHLQELYVRINQDSSFDEESRNWFKKLEEGNQEAIKLWKLFKELSIKEFDKIYKQLNIKFDVISGESFYNNKMEKIIRELKNKNLLEKSEGALVVNLEKYNLGICLIKKSDRATLYATRDITAAIDRHNKYKFSRMIYEVGAEQKLHFQQFFKVLELMGYKWMKECIHIEHGLYLGEDGKKLSTRKGKTIMMENILQETIELSKKEILKREKLKAKELDERASKIALAAIYYGDLKNYRSNDIIFNIERFVSFEGNTGPYLLYTYARAKSILRKAKYNSKKKYELKNKNNPKLNLNDLEKNIVFQLSNFPNIILEAYNSLSPNIIANYAFQISQTFNEFYHSNQVIGSKNEQFLLVLVDSFSQVLKNALSLLGIKVIEKI